MCSLALRQVRLSDVIERKSSAGWYFLASDAGYDEILQELTLIIQYWGIIHVLPVPGPLVSHYSGIWISRRV